MPDLTVLLQEGFRKLATSLVASAIRAGFEALADATDRRVRLDFTDHLERTYDRCTKIKTLLNRDKPTELLSQYVNLEFASGNEKIDDYELIARLERYRHIAISGTAGGGKTVFTRYCWISSFVRSPGGRIPLYIELRRLNNFTTDDLFTYIFRSAFTDDSSVARDLFDKAIKEGRFVFILDGFDEIQEEQRNSIERQILETAHSFPENIIVVSGRPDERFNAWQSFIHFRVAPLNQSRVVELIGKVEFDKTVKKKFLSRVKSDLYVKHRSFLSTPLLATMMLLTFESYADIPDKMHVFYDQAFDTLFAKHDALKEAYKRKSYTSLPIDVFKSHFACFCLITYTKQKYEFSESEIFEEFKSTKKLSQIEIEDGEFFKDLKESVCMLTMDGTKVVFNHRSFQEYFSAYCLSRLSPDRVRMALPKLAARFFDGTFGMLFDMNRNLVEENYFLPVLDKIHNVAEELVKRFDLVEFLEKLNIDMALHQVGLSQSQRKEGNKNVYWIAGFSDDDGIMNCLYKLGLFDAKSESRFDEDFSSHDLLSLKSTSKLADKLVAQQAKSSKNMLDVVEIKSGKKWHINNDLRRELVSWFDKTSDFERIERLLRQAVDLRQELRRRMSERNKSLDELFEIGNA